MTTRKNTRKSTKKKRSRTRKIPGLYAGNDRFDEKFIRILYEGDQRLMLYVYRAKNDRRDGEFIHKCHPFEGLEDFLQNRFGGGEYVIMIRRGSGPFVFSGIISIGVPLNWSGRARPVEIY